MSLCSIEDYLPIQGKCVNGSAIISYILKSKICRRNETQPKNKTIECLACQEGMKTIITNQGSFCEKCANGT